MGAELDISQRHTEELEGSGCALQQVPWLFVNTTYTKLSLGGSNKLQSMSWNRLRLMVVYN